MKKGTIKKIWNTLTFGAVTALAVWKTCEVGKLKGDMKFYAKTLEKAKDLIKEADTYIDWVRFPTVYETKVSKEDEILSNASRNLARALGHIKFVKEDCDLD